MASEWQDMATAPDDGTYILATAGYPYIPCVVRYENGLWLESGQEDPDDSIDWELKWWMPLLDAPNKPQEEPDRGQ